MSSGFPTRSDTNWAVQPLRMARGLKFQIEEVEELYLLCSEIKGADQLRGYRLYFSREQRTGFLMTRLVYVLHFLLLKRFYLKG